MPTLRELLAANRATICEHIYGGPDQFPGLVDEVVKLSKTQRGVGLMLCDLDSLVEAVARAATWPVSIGAADGAALVITNEIVEASNKPRVVAMLTARAERFILTRFGGVRWMESACVYSGEKFHAERGDEPRIVEHEDLTFYPQRRGSLVGAYAIALQKHGMPKTVALMNNHEIDEVRKTWSRELRDGNLEDLEHFAQYCEAKVIHRLVDRLVGLSDQVRGWLSESAPRSKAEVATVTAPVPNPSAVIEQAKSAKRAPIVGLPPRSSRMPLAAGVL